MFLSVGNQVRMNLDCIGLDFEGEKKRKRTQRGITWCEGIGMERYQLNKKTREKKSQVLE
jgi:hypothetical protein